MERNGLKPEQVAVTDDALDTALSPQVFTGEQSNSSIAFGDQTMLKLFRRVTPGVNPDVQVHRGDARGAQRVLRRAAAQLPADSSAFRYLADASARLGQAAAARDAERRYAVLTREP